MNVIARLNHIDMSAELRDEVLRVCGYHVGAVVSLMEAIRRNPVNQNDALLRFMYVFVALLTQL